MVTTAVNSPGPVTTDAGTASSTTTTTTADREQTRRDRRAEVMRWRERLWSWTSLDRLRNCGRVPHSAAGGVIVRVSDTDDGRRAGLSGLQSCGSVWSCPVCSRRISAQRSTEVARVLSAVADAGGSAALITFTMRHRRGHRLAALWEALSTAWSSVTSGRSWTAEQGRFGVLGWVRTVEATHGAHGWHLHVHVVVAFDGPVSADMAGELATRMFSRWSRALGRRGLDAVADRGGLDVRMVAMTAESVEQVSDYIAKITSEITSPSTKDGRITGNRSPFAILRDALGTGLADDCELWISWEQASRGRKQLTWSRDLRAWAGLHVERTDDEIVAADDLHGEDLIVMPRETWERVRSEVSDLLDAAEVGGVSAVTRWLDSRSLPWTTARRHQGGGEPPPAPGPRTGPCCR